MEEWSRRNQVDVVREVSAIDLEHVNRIFVDLVDNLRLNKLLREVDVQSSHNGRTGMMVSSDVEKEGRRGKCCKN